MAERKPCLICGATEGPMCFAGEPYCSEDHRKAMPPMLLTLAKALNGVPEALVAVDDLGSLSQARLDAERRRVEAENGWGGQMLERLCDGCNVNTPWEHRCHGKDVCDCPECRELEAMTPEQIERALAEAEETVPGDEVLPRSRHSPFNRYPDAPDQGRTEMDFYLP